MQKCKRLLLYTACPDALIRLQNGALKNDMEELCHIYFSEQHHSSFQDFMRAHASAHNSNNYFQVSNGNLGMRLSMICTSYMLLGIIIALFFLVR